LTNCRRAALRGYIILREISTYSKNSVTERLCFFQRLHCTGFFGAKCREFRGIFGAKRRFLPAAGADFSDGRLLKIGARRSGFFFRKKIHNYKIRKPWYAFFSPFFNDIAPLFWDDITEKTVISPIKKKSAISLHIRQKWTCTYSRAKSSEHQNIAKTLI